MNKPEGCHQSPTQQPDPTVPDKQSIEELCSDKERHDHLSRDIRITGLVLLIYSIFCFVTLSQVDEIIKTRNVEIPLSDYQIKFSSFLVVGPLALVVITFYLHLFIWEWERVTSVTPERKLPVTWGQVILRREISHFWFNCHGT